MDLGHQDNQVVWQEGLGHIPDAPGLPTQNPFGPLSPGREQNHGNLGGIRPYPELAKDRQAIYPGQRHVKYDQVRLASERQLHSPVAVGRLQHLVSGMFQIHPTEQQDIWVVINYEH
jgi:hypothetical protein